MSTIYIDLDNRWAHKTYRLTFGYEDYRTSVEVNVSGNCLGLFNIESAIDFYYGDLFDKTAGNDYVHLELFRDTPQGRESLRMEDSLGEGETWLANLLVAAELIKLEPYSPSSKATSKKTPT